jgi:hypothetical protein
VAYLKDRIASVVTIGVAAAAYVGAGEFSFSSMIFPRMIAGVMGFCAVLMFLRTITWRLDVPALAAADPNADAPFFRNPAHFGIFFAALVAYLLGITAVGYFTATAGLVVVLALALGFRDYLTLALTTVLFLALIYGVFIIIFERPLPRGVLF